MNKKRFHFSPFYGTIFFVVSVFSFVNCEAQHPVRSSELGVFAGTSYYIGDLNPNVHFKNPYIPALGVFFRRDLNKRYALKFELNHGKLAANDRSSDLPFNDFRNYSFQSTIWDLSGNLEFNFLPYEVGNGATAFLTPYVFIGPAFYYTSISATDGYLALIDTDPPQEKSNLFGFAVDFGAGIKFSLAKKIGVAIGWGMRKTFSDELDGLNNLGSKVLQLSNPKNKDWYNFTGIMLSFKFAKKYGKCPAYY